MLTEWLCISRYCTALIERHWPHRFFPLSLMEMDVSLPMMTMPFIMSKNFHMKTPQKATQLAFFTDFIFRVILRSQQNEAQNRDLPYTSFYHIDRHSTPTTNTPHRVVRLSSQSMNLHWQAIITHGPQFTAGFALGGIHSMGLNKCRMKCINHSSVIQNSFTAPKILGSLPSHLSVPPIPDAFTVFMVFLFQNVI